MQLAFAASSISVLLTGPPARISSRNCLASSRAVGDLDSLAACIASVADTSTYCGSQITYGATIVLPLFGSMPTSRAPKPKASVVCSAVLSGEIVLRPHHQLALVLGVVDDAIDVARGGAVGQAVGDPQQRVGDVELLVEVHDADDRELQLGGEADDRSEHRAHVGGAIAVDLADAEIGRDRIDQHQHNVADLVDLPPQHLQIGLQAEHAIVAGLAHHLDDLDARQIGAGGGQPRHDGVARVILGGEQDHLAAARDRLRRTAKRRRW